MTSSSHPVDVDADLAAADIYATSDRQSVVGRAARSPSPTNSMSSPPPYRADPPSPQLQASYALFHRQEQQRDEHMLRVDSTERGAQFAGGSRDRAREGHVSISLSSSSVASPPAQASRKRPRRDDDNLCYEFHIQFLFSEDDQKSDVFFGIAHMPDEFTVCVEAGADVVDVFQFRMKVGRPTGGNGEVDLINQVDRVCTGYHPAVRAVSVRGLQTTSNLMYVPKKQQTEAYVRLLARHSYVFTIGIDQQETQLVRLLDNTSRSRVHLFIANSHPSVSELGRKPLRADKYQITRFWWPHIPLPLPQDKLPEVICIGMSGVHVAMDGRTKHKSVLKQLSRDVPVCFSTLGNSAAGCVTVSGGPALTPARTITSLSRDDGAVSRNVYLMTLLKPGSVTDEVLKTCASEGINMQLSYTRWYGSSQPRGARYSDEYTCYTTFTEPPSVKSVLEQSVTYRLDQHDLDLWMEQIAELLEQDNFFSRCRVIYMDRFLLNLCGGSRESPVQRLLRRAKTSNPHIIFMGEPGCAPNAGPFERTFRELVNILVVGNTFLLNVKPDWRQASPAATSSSLRRRSVSPPLGKQEKVTSLPAPAYERQSSNECKLPLLHDESMSAHEKEAMYINRLVRRYRDVSLRKDFIQKLTALGKSLTAQPKSPQQPRWLVLTLRHRGLLYLDLMSGNYSYVDNPMRDDDHLFPYPMLAGDIFRGAFVYQLLLRRDGLPESDRLRECVLGASMVAMAKLRYYDANIFFRRLLQPAFRLAPGKTAVVLGCGVIGLTTALVLLRAGYNVHLYAADVLEESLPAKGEYPLASVGGAAFWMPFLLNRGPAGVNAGPPLDLELALREWLPYTKLFPDSVREGFVTVRRGADFSWLLDAPILRAHLAAERGLVVEEEAMEGGQTAITSITFKTVIWEARQCLYALRRLVQYEGGVFFQQQLDEDTVVDLAQHQYRNCYLVNCLGAGGDKILSKSVDPPNERIEEVEGHLLLFDGYTQDMLHLRDRVIINEVPARADAPPTPKPHGEDSEPNFNEKFIDLAYVVGFKDGFALGGTAYRSTAETRSKMHTAHMLSVIKQNIFHNCMVGLAPDISEQMVSALKSREARHIWAYRPSRPSGPFVNFAPSKLFPRLINNYGHGGSGWTLAFASADAVLRLMEPRNHRSAHSPPHLVFEEEDEKRPLERIDNEPMYPDDALMW